MSGVAEKARFYLERAVPQLREFEEKEIFSRDEIRTLVSKRSEFEHKVLAPGCKDTDYLNYIAWDRSLEQLRQKRCRRLGVKRAGTSSHAGQARTLQTFERAVLRHPGSIALWRQYLEYAAEVKATKRWRKVMTRALRLHPTDPALWVAAGRRSAHDGDMETSRAMFMRGCRFCVRDGAVWVEYARVEMEWLERMERKKGTKAFVVAALEQQTEEDGNMMFGADDDDDDDDNDFAEDDAVAAVLKERSKATPKVFSHEMAQKLEKSKALDGALPRAIFDIACKQPFFQASTAEDFWVMLAGFSQVKVQPGLIQHVQDVMEVSYPEDPCTCNCNVRRPIIGISWHDAAFPKALKQSLANLKDALNTTTDRAVLENKTAAWIDPILATEGLDDGLKTVLEFTRRKLSVP